MIYGLIISAGKETRFHDSKPKALSMIGNVCLLDHNIACLKNFCDKVVVVCNNENEQWFGKYEHIVITSGFGCGDAVLRALDEFSFDATDQVFVSWGDCVLSNKVLQNTKEKVGDKHCLGIPCAIEQKPYVRLVKHDNKGNVRVEFGKYGEVNGSGYHDFGVFYGYAKYIRFFLYVFHDKAFDCESGQYKHRHGNEMQFLDVCNETDIDVMLIPMNESKAQSFNTKYELKSIKL